MEVSIRVPRKKKIEAVRLLKNARILPDNYQEIDDFDSFCDDCCVGMALSSPTEICPECKKTQCYNRMDRCPACALKTNKCMQCNKPII